MGIGNLVETNGLEEIESGAESAAVIPPSRPFYYDYVEQGIMQENVSGCFHPSFYYNCDRAMVLYISGGQGDKKSLSTKKRLDTGTAIHEKWEKYFFQSGLLVSTKHRIFTTDPPFSAEPDFIILNHKNMKIYLFELKSREFYAFGRQSSPLAYNARQWQIYSWMAEQWYGIPCCEIGWLHYEDLNLQGWKSYTMMRDQQFLDKELPRYRKWKELSLKKEIPDCTCLTKTGTFDAKGKIAKSCPMKSACGKLFESTGK